jgi:two-component system, chemotaxis family, sensor kinase CheA
MALDLEMEEIFKVFFEESVEGLDQMESGLLNLDVAADRETINTIFRAAHSIKGGAATFGFMEVSGFTHGVETLLDEMRQGTRGVTQDAIQLLLQSVDCLRAMLVATQAGTPVDAPRMAAISDELAQLLASPSPVTVAAPGPVAGVAAVGVAGANASGAASALPAANALPAPLPIVELAAAPSSVVPLDRPEFLAGAAGWSIRFVPHPGILRLRNEPTRMFAELARLGELQVHTDLAGLPPLAELDPEDCHLSWTLLLRGAVSKQAIEEVFDWVSADSRLEYRHFPGVASASTAGAGATQPAGDAPGGEGPTMSASAERGKHGRTSAAAVPAVTTATASVVPAAAASVGASPPSPVAAVSRPASGEQGSIRVSIDKVDNLINLIGELVITQSMLSRFGEDFELDQLERLREGLVQLTRNTRELQESVMQIRMLPISFAFNRFPRLVHDLSRKLGKKVELRLSGEATELDKTVLEKISDPLVHLVRNALDHGLEQPEVRLGAGKPETGLLELAAFHEGGNILIEVKDDGGGLNRQRILQRARERGLVSADAELSDEQVHQLIFAPGFSTAEVVRDVSGRGVGMDVVRRNIQDLGGQVQIFSQEGRGSTIRIRLPLTLAILDGQLVRVAEETYVVSLVAIVETIQVKRDRVSTVAGRTELFRLRDQYIPIIRLHDLFGLQCQRRAGDEGLLVVVEADGHRYGVLVDDLGAQQQVVIKSLDTNFKPVPGLAGATILGDGTVALIIDVPGLVQLFNESAAGVPALAAVA